MVGNFKVAGVLLALAMVVGCAQDSEETSRADSALTSTSDSDDLVQYEDSSGDSSDVSSDLSYSEDESSADAYETRTADAEPEEAMPPGCVGTSSFRTCSDASGNMYSTQRIGDMSMTNGHNARTGSTWNQTTQRIGDNMSITNGRDADGNSWNATTHKIGEDMYMQSGTDSDGNSFSRTCTSTGCF